MSTILCAIDPGASGGIAWNKPGVGVVAAPMPGDMDGVAALAHEIKAASAGMDTSANTPIVCYVEQVTGYVKPSKAELEEGERENRQPGHTMFNFGKSTGAAIMAFKMIGAKIVEVAPRTWQQPLFVKRGPDSKPEWKRTLKALAQQKFPQIKVTLKTCDALLILWFSSLKERAGGVIVPGTAQKPRGEAPASGVDAKRNAQYDITEPGSELSGRHFVADWKGTPFVFRQTENNATILIRKASPSDAATLPTKPK